MEVLIRGLSRTRRSEIPDRFQDFEYDDCTHDVLAELSRVAGIDAATTFFYERIRRAPRNREIVAALDGGIGASSGESNALIAGERRARVLIAPALFYRERPDIGGDGASIQAAARSAGLDVEILPVASAGTVHTNAAELARLLPERVTGPTVLVSLSKGAADVRLAFESVRAIPDDLRAWVVVSGLVHGTPAVDRLRERWWRRWALQLLLARASAPPNLIDDLSSSSALRSRAAAPHGVLVVNVIGCPLTRHVGTTFGRMRHRQMAHLGPNDGLMLLRDAIVDPGLVYPIWGADHYLRTPSVSSIVSRLLAFLATKGCFSVERKVA
ncbi:MAG TPA: hypothetical protein VH740_08575 [Vicinamibacterales bacterium]